MQNTRLTYAHLLEYSTSRLAGWRPCCIKMTNYNFLRQFCFLTNVERQTELSYQKQVFLWKYFIFTWELLYTFSAAFHSSGFLMDRTEWPNFWRITEVNCRFHRRFENVSDSPFTSGTFSRKVQNTLNMSRKNPMINGFFIKCSPNPTRPS